MKKKADNQFKIPMTAGILAGGMSSRMGEDKKFLQWEAETFLDRLAATFSDFSETLVSLNSENQLLSDRYTVVVDSRKGYGPLEGIYQLLQHASFEHILVAAVDMPCLTAELFRTMADQELKEYEILLLGTTGLVHPLCGIYSRSLIPKLEQMFLQEQHSVMQLVRSCRSKLISAEELGFSDDQLANVNTREEYLQLTGREKIYES